MADIIERVKNLLNLSRNNGNVNEAASAAAEAQRLMFKFQIHESDLVISEEDRKPEALVEEGIDSGNKEKVVWKACLANAIAHGFGAEMYNTSGPNGLHHFQIFGLESTVQTVKYMYAYLSKEIARLSDEAWKAHGHEQRQSARTWGNNFRLGAVAVIRARLHEERKAQSAEVRERVAEAKREARPQSTALALFQTNEERVEEGFRVLSRKLRLRTTRTRYRANPNAYQRGREAGSKLSLGGGRGLGAPAKGIES